MNLSECREQAWAGSEANIRMAPFIERRPFYLKVKLCYKRNQCV